MLEINNAVLMVVDIQGKLARIVDDAEAQTKRWVSIIKASKLLNIPILVAEQIPNKLGDTIGELLVELEGVKRYAKSTFSLAKDEVIMNALRETKRTQVILIGIEAHICVYQTALELVNDYDVYILEDLVSSRKLSDKENAVDRMKRHGVSVLTLEMALFELLKTAKHEHFREISKLIK